MRTGAKEEETDVDEEGGVNYVAVKGLGGDKGGGDRGGGHPLNRRREREKEERNQRERRGAAPKR